MNVTNEGFNIQCYTSLGAGATNSIPLNINFSAPTVLGERKQEGKKETEYVLEHFQSSASHFVLSFGVTTYYGWTSGTVGDTNEWFEEYATCEIDVYNDGVLVAQTDRLALPPAPNYGGTETLYVPVTIEADVESIGVLTIKVTSIYYGSGVNAGIVNGYPASKPLFEEIPVTIYSLSYTHEAVSSNTIPIDAEFDASTVYAKSGEGTKDTEYELSGYQAPANSFVLRLTATTYNGWTYSYSDDSSDYYAKAYATCLLSVYNDGVLVAQTEKLALPSMPAEGYMNALDVPVVLEGKVESIGVLTVKATTYYKGEYETVDGDKVPVQLKKVPITINSLSYETDKAVVISTGSALFIAMTGVNSAYSVSK